MKQIRRLSNMIAEELVFAGYEEGSSLFESKVSDIVDMIKEAVEDKEVAEEAEVEVVYMATTSWNLGGVDVVVGDFVEVDDIIEDEATITIYDEDGEVKAEDVTVSLDDIDDFADNSETVDVDYEEMDEAHISFAGGKKHKVTNQQEKMKAKGKGKNFFMKRVNGKWTKIKITPEMKKAMVRNAKKNFKGAARKKAQKTLKKAFKNLKKTRRANEGFDINVNGMNVAVEEGDILVFEGNTVTVIREGNVIVSGISVSESFMSRCISEGVLCDEDVDVAEGKDCSDEDKAEEEAKPADKKDAGSIEEGALLTFRSGKGYVLVREGVETMMGNRVRARAMLTKGGYNVGSRELDKAADGEVVIL